MPLKTESEPAIRKYLYKKVEDGREVEYVNCQEVREDYNAGMAPWLFPIYERCKDNEFRDFKL